MYIDHNTIKAAREYPQTIEFLYLKMNSMQWVVYITGAYTHKCPICTLISMHGTSNSPGYSLATFTVIMSDYCIIFMECTIVTINTIV